ncbi:MAG: ABC transporter [Rhodobacteraceae bacterium]|nr:ABC transporter [Paracoccaceae bacterium]MAY47295.1 ABC transporter [Paracoccaceae bacterium]
MSGLLALLDDVAGIAKVAAASVDDIAGQAAKAGSKAAGALIDDAAVSPKYVHGFDASREIPIIWRITRGSLINKLVILLPIAILLSQFAPWAISPLLMLGGCYLCFEGAEKIAHSLHPGEGHGPEVNPTPVDAGHLEEKRARGAIKTDFILSAEIMTIALSAIPDENWIWMAAVLAIVGIGVTIAVYGAVALIVKMDDFGLFLAKSGSSFVSGLGCWIVRVMPWFMKALTIVGTAAMLWVGGQIVVHGLSELGFAVIGDWIHHAAEVVGHMVPEYMVAATEWIVSAFFYGIFGVALGALLLPVANYVIAPILGLFTGGKKEGAGH